MKTLSPTGVEEVQNSTPAGQGAEFFDAIDYPKPYVAPNPDASSLNPNLF